MRTKHNFQACFSITGLFWRGIAITMASLSVLWISLSEIQIISLSEIRGNFDAADSGTTAAYFYGPLKPSK